MAYSICKNANESETILQHSGNLIFAVLCEVCLYVTMSPHGSFRGTSL